MSRRILLVDSDPELAEALVRSAQDHGDELRRASTVDTALTQLKGWRPDIILLEQELPDGGGMALLDRLRRRDDTPCIMLARNAAAADRVLSLDLGADDHIDRSCTPTEVMARIRCVLRRARAADRGWRLVHARRDVVAPCGRPCRLTPAEYELFRRLAATPGEVVSRKTLCEEALLRAPHPGDRSVDVLMARLRHKLLPTTEAAAASARCIRAVRGIGYVFLGFASPGG